MNMCTNNGLGSQKKEKKKHNHHNDSKESLKDSRLPVNKSRSFVPYQFDKSHLSVYCLNRNDYQRSGPDVSISLIWHKMLQLIQFVRAITKQQKTI